MKQNVKLGAILLIIFLFIGTYAVASFPVKTENNQITTNVTIINRKKNIKKKIQIQLQNFPKKTESNNKVNSITNDEELIILILLWFFLGGIAAHRWYKNKPVGGNILFILTAGGCGVWAIIDLINIITDKF